MTIARRELKMQARQAMNEARPAPFWISLLYTVIGVALGILSMSLSGSLEAYATMFRSAMAGVLRYAEPVAAGGLTGWLLDMALQVMRSVMAVGFVLYAMRVRRHIHASAGDLFDAFGVFFRAIWIELLPSLLLGLWSMVYVLPATVLTAMTGNPWWLVWLLPLMAPTVMASYAYRQAVYLMLDRPDMGCLQCVMASRQMMRGHKWELFKLDMSFMGWYLLVLLPVAGVFIGIWTDIYRQVTNAGYYECLAARAMPGWGAPEPPEL